MWNIETLAPVTPPTVQEHINVLLFSPDGQYLLIGHHDFSNQILIWNMSTLDTPTVISLDKLLISSILDTTFAVFSLDGKIFASNDDNGFLHFWDVGMVMSTLLL